MEQVTKPSYNYPSGQSVKQTQANWEEHDNGLGQWKQHGLNFELNYVILQPKPESLLKNLNHNLYYINLRV